MKRGKIAEGAMRDEDTSYIVFSNKQRREDYEDGNMVVIISKKKTLYKE